MMETRRHDKAGEPAASPLMAHEVAIDRVAEATLAAIDGNSELAAVMPVFLWRRSHAELPPAILTVNSAVVPDQLRVYDALMLLQQLHRAMAQTVEHMIVNNSVDGVLRLTRRVQELEQVIQHLKSGGNDGEQTKEQERAKAQGDPRAAPHPESRTGQAARST